MNWGYNAAYLLHQKDGLGQVPALFAIRLFIEPCPKVYGEDENHPTWYLHSPLAHLSTITCPVSAVWTTADMLVPIDQIGERWVHPFAPSDYPTGMTMEPSRLATSEEGRRRLDRRPRGVPSTSRPRSSADAERGGAPVGVPGHRDDARRSRPLQSGRQGAGPSPILDEGAPRVPGWTTRKYGERWTRDGFLKKHVTGRIAADQLTAVKLDRLMDRYADRECRRSALKPTSTALERTS